MSERKTTFIETFRFKMHPGIPVGYLSFTLLLAILVEEFNVVVKIVASVFLVELDGFSHNDGTSQLKVIAECFL